MKELKAFFYKVFGIIGLVFAAIAMGYIMQSTDPSLQDIKLVQYKELVELTNTKCPELNQERKDLMVNGIIKYYTYSNFVTKCNDIERTRIKKDWKND